MKAFLDDPQLKADLLEQIKWHREQDAIIQGTYGEGSGKNWKGCAVGCSIHSLSKLKGREFDTSGHRIYETELGIPEWLARLEDALFEGLPKEAAVKWPERFIQSISVGADLYPVKWKFFAHLMKCNIDEVLSLDLPGDLKEQVVGAIRGVLALHEEAVRAGKWDESATEFAWSALKLAADYAWSSADSGCAQAARAAAICVDTSMACRDWGLILIRPVFDSAWPSNYACFAYQKHADKLIELLEEVK